MAKHLQLILEDGLDASVLAQIPEAYRRLDIRRVREAAGPQYWEHDGYSITIRAVGDIEFIHIGRPAPVVFEFFTPKLKSHDWAGFIVPEGYITRVDSKGVATVVGHSDSAKAGAVTTNELWVLWGYAHGPQVQAINQYQFWPDRHGPQCCLTTWHRDLPCPDTWYLGVSGTHDSGFDLPPTASSSEDNLVGSVNGSAPDTDWYKRATYNPTTELYYMVTADLNLYLFRASAFNSVPPNITEFAVFDLKTILPAYVNVPIGPFKDSAGPWWPDDYPDYKWAWRSDCAKMAAIVTEDGSGWDNTVLVEIDVAATINQDNSLSLSATLARAERSAYTHGKCYLGAEYAYNTALRTYTNPEPLLTMYTKYFYDSGANSKLARLYVEDADRLLFTFDLIKETTDGTYGYRHFAQILGMDLRSLSFVFHTRVQNSNTTAEWYAWDEAVLVYSFGRLQHSHGFFGYSPATAAALFASNATPPSPQVIPASSGELSAYQVYAHISASTGLTAFPNPRTSFQVHPKGHFSVVVGPILASDHALPITYDYVTPPSSAADVTIEQHHVDIIGFNLGGYSYKQYSHREKCNEAFGLTDTISAYDYTVSQFDYYANFSAPYVYYKVLSMTHFTNPTQITYKRTNFNYKQSNASAYGYTLATYKVAGDTSRTAWEIANTGVTWYAWPFQMPYVRGESQFIGGKQ